jgi:uncharacterized membrane protein YecN with MAPEG domain
MAETQGFKARTVFIVSGLIILTTLFYLSFLGQKEILFFPLLSLSLIYMKSNSSKRKSFYESVYNKTDLPKIQLAENIVISSPIILTSLLTLELNSAVIILIICGMLYLLSAKSRGLQFLHILPFIPTPFKTRPFEFTSGFRKLILVYPIILFVLFKAWQVSNFNLALGSLGLTLLISI